MKNKQPPWTLRWVVVILVLGFLAPSTQGRLLRCQVPPSFRRDGVIHRPVQIGSITMVALLTNTCSFCLQQARTMMTNRTDLEAAAGNDLHMMIIDAGPSPQPNMVGRFQSIVSFDVHQDDRHQTIWKNVYGGQKDDILIFNRCGMLTYKLPFPYSYLSYNYIYRALRLTHNNPSICPACQEQQQHSLDMHDRMMGDAPAAERFESRHPFRRRGYSRRSSHHQSNHVNRRRSRNRSRCPRNDHLCRELRRGGRLFHYLRNNNLNEEAFLQTLNGLAGNRLTYPVA